MRHEGTAKLDKRTKDLVKRLGPNDIAIIDHVDMDRVRAETLLASGVEVVINAAQSISGAYPNIGPLILARGGVTIIDNTGEGIFGALREGDDIVVEGENILKDGVLVGKGTRFPLPQLKAPWKSQKIILAYSLISSHAILLSTSKTKKTFSLMRCGSLKSRRRFMDAMFL